MLTRYIRALCPHQKMDEYTSDAWHDVLSREPWITLSMARTAVVDVKLRQPFIDVSEIIAQAKVIRRAAGDQERREALVGPVRAQRDELKDPRPLRSTIRALVSEHFGRPELTP
jgi:hypothetical protein